MKETLLGELGSVYVDDVFWSACKGDFLWFGRVSPSTLVVLFWAFSGETAQCDST